jgi:hypothetical protein
MSFRYACFISYRRHEEETIREMVEQFHKALAGELEPLVGGGKIFRDTNILKAGDFLEKKISNAICQSVCMIMVYTPTYFDKDHTYCVREFKTMEKIESERLKLLPPSHNDHGLIIPVIFRGSRFFPQEIKIKRIFFNFENFLLCHREMNKHPDYAPKIREIADYIADLCSIFAKFNGSIFTKMKEDKLLTNEEIKSFLDGHVKEWQIFPGNWHCGE